MKFYGLSYLIATVTVLHFIGKETNVQRSIKLPRRPETQKDNGDFKCYDVSSHMTCPRLLDVNGAVIDTSQASAKGIVNVGNKTFLVHKKVDHLEAKTTAKNGRFSLWCSVLFAVLDIVLATYALATRKQLPFLHLKPTGARQFTRTARTWLSQRKCMLKGIFLKVVDSLLHKFSCPPVRSSLYEDTLQGGASSVSTAILSKDGRGVTQATEVPHYPHDVWNEGNQQEARQHLSKKSTHANESLLVARSAQQFSGNASEVVRDYSSDAGNYPISDDNCNWLQLDQSNCNQVKAYDEMSVEVKDQVASKVKRCVSESDISKITPVSPSPSSASGLACSEPSIPGSDNTKMDGKYLSSLFSSYMDVAKLRLNCKGLCRDRVISTEAKDDFSVGYFAGDDWLDTSDPSALMLPLLEDDLQTATSLQRQVYTPLSLADFVLTPSPRDDCVSKSLTLEDDALNVSFTETEVSSIPALQNHLHISPAALCPCTEKSSLLHDEEGTGFCSCHLPKVPEARSLEPKHRFIQAEAEDRYISDNESEAEALAFGCWDVELFSDTSSDDLDLSTLDTEETQQQLENDEHNYAQNSQAEHYMDKHVLNAKCERTQPDTGLVEPTAAAGGLKDRNYVDARALLITSDPNVCMGLDNIIGDTEELAQIVTSDSESAGHSIIKTDQVLNLSEAMPEENHTNWSCELQEKQDISGDITLHHPMNNKHLHEVHSHGDGLIDPLVAGLDNERVEQGTSVSSPPDSQAKPLVEVISQSPTSSSADSPETNPLVEVISQSPTSSSANSPETKPLVEVISQSPTSSPAASPETKPLVEVISQSPTSSPAASPETKPLVEVISQSPTSSSANSPETKLLVEVISQSPTSSSAASPETKPLVEVISQSPTSSSANSPETKPPVEVISQSPTSSSANSPETKLLVEVISQSPTSSSADSPETKPLVEVISQSPTSSSAASPETKPLVEVISQSPTSSPAASPETKPLVEVISQSPTSSSANSPETKPPVEVISQSPTSSSAASPETKPLVEVISQSPTSSSANSPETKPLVEVISQSPTSSSAASSETKPLVEVISQSAASFTDDSQETKPLLESISVSPTSLSADSPETKPLLEVISQSPTSSSADSPETKWIVEIFSQSPACSSADRPETKPLIEVISQSPASSSADRPETKPLVEVISRSSASSSAESPETKPLIEVISQRPTSFLADSPETKPLVEIISQSPASFSADSPETKPLIEVISQSPTFLSADGRLIEAITQQSAFPQVENQRTKEFEKVVIGGAASSVDDGLQAKKFQDFITQTLSRKGENLTDTGTEHSEAELNRTKVSNGMDCSCADTSTRAERCTCDDRTGEPRVKIKNEDEPYDKPSEKEQAYLDSKEASTLCEEDAVEINKQQCIEYLCGGTSRCIGDLIEEMLYGVVSAIEDKQSLCTELPSQVSQDSGLVVGESCDLVKQVETVCLTHRNKHINNINKQTHNDRSKNVGAEHPASETMLDKAVDSYNEFESAEVPPARSVDSGLVLPSLEESRNFLTSQEEEPADADSNATDSTTESNLSKSGSLLEEINLQNVADSAGNLAPDKTPDSGLAKQMPDTKQAELQEADISTEKAASVSSTKQPVDNTKRESQNTRVEEEGTASSVKPIKGWSTWSKNHEQTRVLTETDNNRKFSQNMLEENNCETMSTVKEEVTFHDNFMSSASGITAQNVSVEESVTTEKSTALERSDTTKRSDTVERNDTLERSGMLDRNGTVDRSGKEEGSGMAAGSGTAKRSDTADGSGTVERSGTAEGSGTVERIGTAEGSGMVERSGPIENSGTVKDDVAGAGHGVSMECVMTDGHEKARVASTSEEMDVSEKYVKGDVLAEGTVETDGRISIQMRVNIHEGIVPQGRAPVTERIMDNEAMGEGARADQRGEMETSVSTEEHQAITRRARTEGSVTAEERVTSSQAGTEWLNAGGSVARVKETTVKECITTEESAVTEKSATGDLNFLTKEDAPNEEISTWTECDTSIRSLTTEEADREQSNTIYDDTITEDESFAAVEIVMAEGGGRMNRSATPGAFPEPPSEDQGTPSGSDNDSSKDNTCEHVNNTSIESGQIDLECTGDSGDENRINNDILYGKRDVYINAYGDMEDDVMEGGTQDKTKDLLVLTFDIAQPPDHMSLETNSINGDVICQGSKDAEEEFPKLFMPPDFPVEMFEKELQLLCTEDELAKYGLNKTGPIGEIKMPEEYANMHWEQEDEEEEEEEGEGSRDDLWLHCAECCNDEFDLFDLSAVCISETKENDLKPCPSCFTEKDIKKYTVKREKWGSERKNREHALSGKLEAESIEADSMECVNDCLINGKSTSTSSFGPESVHSKEFVPLSRQNSGHHMSEALHHCDSETDMGHNESCTSQIGDGICTGEKDANWLVSYEREYTTSDSQIYSVDNAKSDSAKTARSSCNLVFPEFAECRPRDKSDSGRSDKSFDSKQRNRGRQVQSATKPIDPLNDFHPSIPPPLLPQPLDGLPEPDLFYSDPCRRDKRDHREFQNHPGQYGPMSFNNNNCCPPSFFPPEARGPPRQERFDRRPYGRAGYRPKYNSGWRGRPYFERR